LLLEHPHTFTFGRKGHAENLLWSPEELTRRGISVHWVDRGGDVTYHGPGQLVGYPLLPLTPLPAGEGPGVRSDYVGYVRRLEKTLIAALARLGLVTGQRSGLTGVWVQADVHSRCPRCRPEDRTKPAKLAAIGVKVDVRGVTRHGFALNVNPDMEYWDGIVACGLSEYPVVSLADLLSPVPSMERVKAEVTAAFRAGFEWDGTKPA
jgi:lipoate-protein ligase B